MHSSGAIYFDGSLPASKRAERHRRSCANSGEVQSYFTRTVSGIKPRDPDQIFSIKWINALPDPSFFVPSILETLRGHERYGLLTHLVPGEADPYCARDVEKSGGIILTSDSDLLLYDIGPEGSVVFFKDLQFDHQADAGDTHAEGSIVAATYKQRTLCQRLSLESGQVSMLQLGFELTKRTRSRNLPPHSQWACFEYAAEYAVFALGYQSAPGFFSTTQMDVALLDPRISEFVLDWARIPTNQAQNFAQDLTVWLPFLIDRWDQESAWNMSTTIRQLAYSLCHFQGSERPNPVVREYKRTMSAQSPGQAVELVESSAAVDGVRDLIAYVDRFLDEASNQLQWVTVCLGLEIGYAAQEGRESNALKLWRQAARSEGKLDSSTWDSVHLAALLQGTLYSFRMLHQVLTSRTGEFLASTPMAPVAQRLSSLPSIAEFPSAAGMDTLFEQLHHDGQLDLLAQVTGTEDIPFGTTGKASRKRQKRENKLGQQPLEKLRGPQPSRALSNPFDVLTVPKDW